MGMRLKALLAVAAIAGGAGCSTTNTLAQATPQRYAQDADYVAQVEKLARKRGVRVHWVNAPLKLY